MCTPALMDETLDSAHVAGICAEIEDALEAYRRGELTRDEYDTLKGDLKKRLPIFTFHATFKNGRRKNDEVSIDMELFAVNKIGGLNLELVAFGSHLADHALDIFYAVFFYDFTKLFLIKGKFFLCAFH